MPDRQFHRKSPIHDDGAAALACATMVGPDRAPLRTELRYLAAFALAGLCATALGAWLLLPWLRQFLLKT